MNRKNTVSVRQFKGGLVLAAGILSCSLRESVGQADEMAGFLAAIKQIVRTS